MWINVWNEIVFETNIIHDKTQKETESFINQSIRLSPENKEKLKT